MIQVRCTNCDTPFDADDDSAGLSEYCPNCGTLNDVPALEAGGLSIEPGFRPVLMTPASLARGRSAGTALWWGAALAAVGAFVVACWFLLRPNWEMQHLQALADEVNQGDSLMAVGDYGAAQQQYQTAVGTVGNRAIVSDYLRDLVNRARHGAAEAQARLNAKPATAASTSPSPAQGDLAPDEGDIQQTERDAIRGFQRASEGFADYVRQHPFLVSDSLGRWSRRRYVVWDVTCELQQQVGPAQMTLGYVCSVRSTVPHDQKDGANGDSDFIVVDPAGVIHCQTYYLLRGGRWVVLRRVRDDEMNRVASLENLFGLEQAAFGVAGK